MEFDDQQLRDAIAAYPLPWRNDCFYKDGGSRWMRVTSSGGHCIVEAPDYRERELDVIVTVANAFYRDRLRQRYMISDLERIIDDRIKAHMPRRD